MSSGQVQLLFVDLALILFAARGLGHLAIRIGQPPVVGEILTGVLLGPTLLDGAIANTLFPGDVRPLLEAMANVGVALFMFGVGLEIDTRALRGRGRITAAAATGSTVVPFVLGVVLALGLLGDHPTRQPVAFTVFIGLAVSVTAFPVLARILADRKLSGTAIGGLALATAALVDVVAWAGLAGLQAAVGGEGRHWAVALVLPFTAVMLLVVRPLLRRVLLPGGRAAVVSPRLFVLLLAGVLLSAAVTEAVGMHFIFGAFLFGLVMPREDTSGQRADVLGHLGRLTSLLLPVYFVVAGLQVDLSGLGGTHLLQLVAILAVAVAGKFGGTFGAVRTQGLPARQAAVLGALMNTRGLTELVILGVGLRLGLLDSSLYSLMVVMAVVTTAMTGPALSRLHAKPVETHPTAEEREPATDTITRI